MRMKQFTLLALIAMLALPPPAGAGPPQTIGPKNGVLCDDDRRVCLRGTLTYYPDPRLLELRSRVQKAEGPGLLKIRVIGENALGHTRLTTMEVRIRGNYSEIVDSKLITDHPDVYSWRLESISFAPAPPAESSYP